MTLLYKYGDYSVVRVSGEICIFYKTDCIYTCEDHIEAVLKMNQIKQLEYAN